MDGALAAAGIPGRRRLGEEGEGADSTTEGSGSGLSGSRVGGSSVSASDGAGLRKSTSSGSGGYGFLSALSHSITGMMDVDPEATRRNNISKTRDTISQVCLRPTPFAGLRSFADPFLSDVLLSAGGCALPRSAGPQVRFADHPGRPRSVSAPEGQGHARHVPQPGDRSPRLVQAGPSMTLFAPSFCFRDHC